MRLCPGQVLVPPSLMVRQAGSERNGRHLRGIRLKRPRESPVRLFARSATAASPGRRSFGIPSVLLLLVALSGCAAVRHQLGMSLVPPETEIELGRRLSREIEAGKPVLRDSEIQRYAAGIGRPLVLASHRDRPGIRYRIRVLDEDLGKSGTSSENRDGFRQLVASVAVGEVGIVMGLEVSRLARNNADWHRLLELASQARTLILDETGVYDPHEFNDRILLGLKGSSVRSSCSASFPACTAGSATRPGAAR